MAETPGLAVLVSGNGSNLAAIADAIESGQLNATIEVVVSNNPDAYALERAANAGLKTETLNSDGLDRKDYDAKLAELVASYDPDIVVLAGWNRLLSSVFLASQLVINLHPALPGTFAGLGCIEKTYQAFQAGEVEIGGVMVHYVPDEGVDDGPVILSREVPISKSDSLEDYANRVHDAEHIALPEAIAQVGAEMFP